MMNKAGWTVCLATLISSGVVAGEWEIEAGDFSLALTPNLTPTTLTSTKYVPLISNLISI
ncbi:hypothetical protein OGZ01_19595 [Vibrio harveyi]|nr:hypothetical protein [Vibrio harveyi]